MKRKLAIAVVLVAAGMFFVITAMAQTPTGPATQPTLAQLKSALADTVKRRDLANNEYTFQFTALGKTVEAMSKAAQAFGDLDGQVRVLDAQVKAVEEAAKKETEKTKKAPDKK